MTETKKPTRCQNDGCRKCTAELYLTTDGSGIEGWVCRGCRRYENTPLVSFA